MTKITEEMYAAIPALLQEGKGKREIAKLFGTSPSSLQVLCSKRGISLRQGGRLQKRQTLSLPLPDAQLTLSEDILRALRTTARARGMDDVQLASELLKTIVKDNLYSAVLDTEAA